MKYRRNKGVIFVIRFLEMNIIDILLGALLLFGLIRGLSKGLFVEIASLVALIAGVYGAIHFSNFIAGYLMQYVEWSEKVVNITAFAITFVIIVVAISLAGKALTKLADFAALGLLNKLLGGVFGLLKVGLILSIILLVFTGFNRSIPLVDQADLDESVLYEPVKSLAPALFPGFITVESASAEADTAENTE